MAAPVPEGTQSQEPLFTQLKGLPGVYWIANWMELVERFAYYGVRTVLPIFMVLAIGAGGPEFDHIQKGTVFAIWALVQSIVPVFTGGFADRYGYKINIAVATVLKIIGYILMGYCIVFAEAIAGVPLPEARAQGIDQTYAIFFTGAMFLALGTAIFKPGLQGLIAHQMPKNRASVGWAMFYQMVNVGGFLGPLIAGYLRVLEWEYVFLACAIAISLNFIPLFLFREPEHHGEENTDGPLQLIPKAIHGLLEPRLFFFTITFAGFWLMFYQLFDILPNFIEDWVDSRAIVDFLHSIFGEGLIPLNKDGNLTQEWMLNVNALLISIFAFSIGFLTGKVRALTAIIIGIGISAVGIYGLGMSMSGWWIIGMIAIFSFGEMSASPTKMRYLASIAPEGKEGLYMGYVNFTVGIGWSIGSLIAAEMYQKGGDKVVLARRYLETKLNMDAQAVADIPKDKLMPFFQDKLGIDGWEARELLWNTYEPYSMWAVFTLIGIASLIGIVAYNYVTRKADEDPSFSFNTHGQVWVRAALVPIIIAFAWFSYYKKFVDNYDWIKVIAPIALAVIFLTLLIFSFLPNPEAVAAKEASGDLPKAKAKDAAKAASDGG